MLKYQSSTSGALLDVIILPGQEKKSDGTPLGYTVYHPDTGRSWGMGENGLKKALIDPKDIAPMSEDTFRAALKRLGLNYEEATGKVDKLTEKQVTQEQASVATDSEAQ